RPETGDFQDLLDRPAAADDFAIDGPDRGVVEWPFVVLQDVLKDLLFAAGGEYLTAAIAFQFTDLRREPGPLVDQLEDVEVELIDLRAKRLERGERAICRSGMARLVLARHDSPRLNPSDRSFS